MNRRQSLTTLAGLAALPLTSNAAPIPTNPKICCFTKVFQALPFNQLAETIAELGFDGIEAPIRPGGHIEPESVPDQLPALTEALAKTNTELTILASGINTISPDQHTESVLRTAADLGIDRYRMAYYKYDKDRPIRAQLADFKAQLTDLSALNQELGIQGLYQNHAGSNYCGGPIWDICSIIEDLPREAIALAFDIRHATVEGASSWDTNTRLALPLSGAIYIKDFTWADSPKPINTPLGEGRVSPDFFNLLAKTPVDGPISLHVEYIHAQQDNAIPRATQAYKNDLTTLHALLQ